MAIGTKTLAPSELDAFEDTRLTEELRKAKEELFNLRFQSATGQLEGHGRVRAVKRDIARIYTVMRERELGIRATPAPAPVAEAMLLSSPPQRIKIEHVTRTGSSVNHMMVAIAACTTDISRIAPSAKPTCLVESLSVNRRNGPIAANSKS